MPRKEPNAKTLPCPGTCGQDALARPTGLHGQRLIDSHLDGAEVCPGSWLPPPADPEHPSVREANRLLCRDRPAKP